MGLGYLRARGAVSLGECGVGIPDGGLRRERKKEMDGVFGAEGVLGRLGMDGRIELIDRMYI
jgi:hypothetical protein